MEYRILPIEIEGYIAEVYDEELIGHIIMDDDGNCLYQHCNKDYLLDDQDFYWLIEKLAEMETL